MNLRTLAAVVAALPGLGAPALADTADVSASGFVSTFREEVRASPDAVWQAIVQLPRWWSDRHTYSGRADRMSLDLQAGGCWCERWGEGQSVMHGQVLLVQPGRVLRLSAPLGPLQALAVQGVLTLGPEVSDGRTFLRLSYRVSGSADAALDKIAPAVDQVLAQQLKRLKSLAETGRAE